MLSDPLKKYTEPFVNLRRCNATSSQIVCLYVDHQFDNAVKFTLVLLRELTASHMHHASWFMAHVI